MSLQSEGDEDDRPRIGAVDPASGGSFHELDLSLLARRVSQCARGSVFLGIRLHPPVSPSSGGFLLLGRGASAPRFCLALRLALNNPIQVSTGEPDGWL